MTSGAARMPCIMPAPATSNGVGSAMSIPSQCASIWRSRLGPLTLSRLPAPERHVRHRACVPVYSKAPTAGWAVTQWLATLAQHHGDEFCDRGDRRRPDLAHRHRTVPVRVPPNYASRGLGRSMAVLRAAPVCDDILGTQRRVDISRGGPARKLALRAAGDPALVHCQYRRAPCPPPRERHSLLPPAAGAAGLSRASRREPAYAS